MKCNFGNCNNESLKYCQSCDFHSKGRCRNCLKSYLKKEVK